MVTCLKPSTAGDLTNIADMSTHSNKGTQGGKSQLDKAVPTLVIPASQESVVYSLDNLFPSMSSVCNTPLLDQDVQEKEPALNFQVALFPFFHPKDHFSLKSMDPNEIEMEKASKPTKIRGKKAGEKRNRGISKKKARKVKFEEREHVEFSDVQEQVPLNGELQERD
ncbi:hypothetical protein NDU88_003587 [Pleurodeles waltl]|uniref:Uncharacterized protein n=1 Tax=Pleurodeles waltl TaxID=8319 RepID=A0AAV7UYU3_PLEWA|nr:hypothetical protein NDU88_003587 [Pleurodeles waltl]